MRARLQRDLASTDPVVHAPYFLQAPADSPERVGYFAGWQLVSAFAQEHAVAELARWPPQRIQERVAPALVDVMTGRDGQQPPRTSGRHAAGS